MTSRRAEGKLCARAGVARNPNTQLPVRIMLTSVFTIRGLVIASATAMVVPFSRRVKYRIKVFELLHFFQDRIVDEETRVLHQLRRQVFFTRQLGVMFARGLHGRDLVEMAQFVEVGDHFVVHKESRLLGHRSGKVGRSYLSSRLGRGSRDRRGAAREYVAEEDE